MAGITRNQFTNDAKSQLTPGFTAATICLEYRETASTSGMKSDVGNVVGHTVQRFSASVAGGRELLRSPFAHSISRAAARHLVVRSLSVILGAHPGPR
jgi:hypothetical protein